MGDADLVADAPRLDFQPAPQVRVRASLALPPAPDAGQRRCGLLHFAENALPHSSSAYESPRDALSDNVSRLAASGQKGSGSVGEGLPVLPVFGYRGAVQSAKERTYDCDSA